MHNCTSGADDGAAGAPLNVSWHGTATDAGSRKGWRSRLRHGRLPWRPTQEPPMKRNSQSRIEHQKAQPAAPKNPATSEKAQSNQYHCGSSECDQSAAPGTAMEFSFKGCAVRSVLQAGEPWFVAADVCAILALTNSRQKVSNLDENEKGVTNAYTLGGEQGVSCRAGVPQMPMLTSSRLRPHGRTCRDPKGGAHEHDTRGPAGQP